MVILFTTYPLDIQRAIVIFQLFGFTANTLAKYSNALVILILGLQHGHIFRSSYSGAPPKSEHFFDLPNPHFLFKPFDFKSNEFEFKTFKNAHSIFLGTCAFLRVWEYYSHAQILPLTLFYLFSFLFISLFFLKKRRQEREERDQQAGLQGHPQAQPAVGRPILPAQPLRPSLSPR